MGITRWTESATGFDRIDREAGVIRGVKVLGAQSRNGRKYLREAVLGGVSKYQGRKVYIDHTEPNGAKVRKTRERWGRLANVHERAGELFGDLEYLKSHPMTEQILEAVERFEDSGLSHDAEGRVEKVDGVDCVYEIVTVNSVDLVTDPATTKSLFEQMDSETSAGFRAAVMAIVDGEGTVEDQIAKLQELILARAELKDEGKSVDEAKAAELETTNKKLREEIDRMKAESESGKSQEQADLLKRLQEENAALKAERAKQELREACHKLLIDSKREPSDVRVSALMAIPEDSRAALVESWPEQQPESSGTQKPASSQSVLNEADRKRGGGGSDKVPTNFQEFREAICGA